MTGIDAAVELAGELDRLGRSGGIARQAPRSKALYRYLSDGLQGGGSSGLPADEFAQLVVQLIQRLSIWWSPNTYKRLPVMVPWCVRDRSCRYDQGPESWGAPRADACFRDDNSIIKKLPLSCTIFGPANHPYRRRRIWRGFTACHIWRDLPDGSVAGADPWLYSFVPNLVWLPSWLAPLTDRQSAPVQHLLQRTSLALYRETAVASPLLPYIEQAWARLPPPPGEKVLAIDALAMFEPDEGFYQRRVRYLDKFIEGCEAILSGGGAIPKLVSSRYTVGLPKLETGALSAFSDAMAQYRAAVIGAGLEVDEARWA